MDSLTQILRALSDPTRRAVLDLLAKGSLSVTDLAKQFELSRPAVSKHLGILREAGLVVARRQGRRQIYELDTAALKPVHEWLGRHRRTGRGERPRRMTRIPRSAGWHDWKCW